jgi:DNA invertase Pin-like site-specific DNA recombinase
LALSIIAWGEAHGRVRAAEADAKYEWLWRSLLKKWEPSSLNHGKFVTCRWARSNHVRTGGVASIRRSHDGGGELPDQKIFSEQVSSVAQRPQLEAALDYLRDGDALVVTKLDRLARSGAHLVAIGERLHSKGVTLKVLDQAIDTSTPTGRLMFNMLGSIAQFERELMLERQREGIAKAKAAGKYKGRKPTAKAKTPEIKRLMADGIGPTAIARQLGISRASVYRFLAA